MSKEKLISATFQLTKEQMEALKPLFDKVESEYLKGTPGGIIAQPRRSRECIACFFHDKDFRELQKTTHKYVFKKEESDV